jgi:uncharacterized protein YcbK (DUF882 family)
MVTLAELNPKKYELTPEQEANQKLLHTAVNHIRKLYGKPMHVTSGVRSMADQMRINPKAPKSKHLLGQAVDIADPTGELYKWLKANPEALKDAGLWCEEGTVGWCHLQVVPPKSGKRWFKP